MFASGFPVLGSFSKASAEILDSKMLLLLSTISFLFDILFEWNQKNGQGMMLVLPNQRLS